MNSQIEAPIVACTGRRRAFAISILRIATIAPSEKFVINTTNTTGTMDPTSPAKQIARPPDKKMAFRHGSSKPKNEILDLAPDVANSLPNLFIHDFFNASCVAENQLKATVTNKPSLATRPFPQGNLATNLYRWNEARVNYFRAAIGNIALRGSLYNLTVSLYNTKQFRQAAQHDHAPLAATEPGGNAPFDLDRPRQRGLGLRL